MRRVSQWPRALSAALERMRDTPFSWGTHDCGLAAASVIHAITGTDPAAEIRGTYTTAAGAALKMGGGLEAFAVGVAERLGCREVAVLRAGRGDAVLFDTEDGPALGIVDLDGMHAVASGPSGWVRIPLRQCRRAWHV